MPFVFHKEGEAKLHPSCPGCALACYVECTEQLVVAFRDGMVGEAISKNHLAGWLLYGSASPEPIGGQEGTRPPLPWRPCRLLKKVSDSVAVCVALYTVESECIRVGMS